MQRQGKGSSDQVDDSTSAEGAAYGSQGQALSRRPWIAAYEKLAALKGR